MALERLEALATARIPDLDRPDVGSPPQRGRVAGEGHRPDVTSMALERLEALATARILDLDCPVAAARVPCLDRPVVRRRRQPRRIVGEGHRPDHIAMALERLEALVTARIPNLDRA